MGKRKKVVPKYNPDRDWGMFRPGKDDELNLIAGGVKEIMDTSRELGRVSVNLRITEIENGYVVETILTDAHLGPKFFPLPRMVVDYCHDQMRIWEHKELADAKE